jgi:hypothetical protein
LYQVLNQIHLQANPVTKFKKKKKNGEAGRWKRKEEEKVCVFNFLFKEHFPIILE